MLKDLQFLVLYLKWLSSSIRRSSATRNQNAHLLILSLGFREVTLFPHPSVCAVTCQNRIRRNPFPPHWEGEGAHPMPVWKWRVDKWAAVVAMQQSWAIFQLAFLWLISETGSEQSFITAYCLFVVVVYFIIVHSKSVPPQQGWALALAGRLFSLCRAVFVVWQRGLLVQLLPTAIMRLFGELNFGGLCGGSSRAVYLMSFAADAVWPAHINNTSSSAVLFAGLNFLPLKAFTSCFHRVKNIPHVKVINRDVLRERTWQLWLTDYT